MHGHKYFLQKKLLSMSSARSRDKPRLSHDVRPKDQRGPFTSDEWHSWLNHYADATCRRHLPTPLKETGLRPPEFTLNRLSGMTWQPSHVDSYQSPSRPPIMPRLPIMPPWSIMPQASTCVAIHRSL
jgi:hypothetical protein